MNMMNMRYRWIGICVLLAALLASCTHAPTPWQLNDVIRGHLPDLKFSLVNDHGKEVTQDDYLGDKISVLYFGYTHCPDVCPITLARLHQVMQQLGADKNKVQVLFVSVDPERDTPAIMHQYVDVFDANAIGLTGSIKQIKHMAKRYRVAFNKEGADQHGNYEVSHSSGLYIFDRHGHARLLGTFDDHANAISHDLELLIKQEFDHHPQASA